MVSSDDEPEAKTGDTLEWDVDMEIQLFYAMANHKPVGINKHFNMACIWEKLSNSITKEVTTQDIWKHLETLYDIQMLDDTEPIPFPNNDVPFTLPENEFGALMKQKCKEAILADDSDGAGNSSGVAALNDGRSPSPKTTPRSSSRGTVSKDSASKANRKDSTSGLLSTKSRKESGSSHASTDTPSIKSEKDYDRRRDSRDSNASGPRESSTARKSLTQKDKPAKSKVNTVAACDSPLADDESGNRRGRRRGNTSTPPSNIPAKRRRT